MQSTRKLTAIAAGIGMLALILGSPTALEGARQGLDLCIRVVIPSLFPFFVLSILLTDNLMGTGMRVLRPLGKLCKIPEGGESILVAAFLGGYPVGAQAIAEATRSGQLSPKDARRMLGFCNNAGPSFLFGMVGAMFPKGYMIWLLWGIQIVSSVLTAILLPRCAEQPVRLSEKPPISFPESLRKAIPVMAGVCGWVVMFRVILAFLNRWLLWLLPDGVQAAVAGLLELSNGCCVLDRIENVGLRFVVCSGILAFGGLCVTMQTLSVSQGVPFDLYVPGKLMQTLFAVSLAALIQPLFPSELRLRVSAAVCGAVFLLLAAIPVILIKTKKYSSIPGVIGV